MIPENLSQELETALKNCRNKRTGESLSEGTKTSYRQALHDFYTITAPCAKARNLERLADFQEADIDAYKRFLEQSPSHPKPNTIITRVMAINGIFKAALAQKMIPKKIGLKVYWPKGEEQYRRLHQNELDKLFAVNEKQIEKMNLKAQFIYLRNKTMSAVQKDAALRASEIVHLGLDNILWTQRSHGGHIPVEIWEGKRRAKNAKESAYLSPWGATWLKRYLDIRAVYLKETGLKAAHSFSPKSQKDMGEVVFISERRAGPIAGSSYISKIFPSLIQEAGLPKEYTSHYLRHTRISEWVESGLDPKRVQRLARHESLEMTLKYYNFNEKELIEDLDKRFGHAVETPNKPLLLPDKAVSFKIMSYALKSVGQEPSKEVLETLYGSFNEELKPGSSQKLYYSVYEVCERLRIHRTQLYVGWIKAGWLHPFKLGKGTVFLKTEVDDLAAYRTSEEASKALGYREKTPVTISRLADQGIIAAVKMGRGWRFKDRDLINFAVDKHSGRLRLVRHVKAKTPAMFPLRTQAPIQPSLQVH